MNRDERFKIYKNILSLEPRTWTNNHHVLRIGLNVISTNILIFYLFKHMRYIKIKNCELVKLNNNTKYFNIIKCFLLIGSIQYFNYKVLNNFIYDNYYSEEDISDEELLNLLSEIKISKNVNRIIENKLNNKMII